MLRYTLSEVPVPDFQRSIHSPMRDLVSTGICVAPGAPRRRRHDTTIRKKPQLAVDAGNDCALHERKHGGDGIRASRVALLGYFPALHCCASTAIGAARRLRVIPEPNARRWGEQFARGSTK
jgi:hypothetical protein